MLPTAGGDLSAAYLQSAEEFGLPQEKNRIPEDQTGTGGHWRAAKTEPGRQARLPADRHGSSRRSGGDERCVSHQCGGRDDAMASGGSYCADLGGVVDSSAGSDAAAVSLSHPRFSFRQRERVHQSQRGGAIEQVIGGANQIAAAALQRQWPGRSQEWGGDPKAYGVWPHCGGTRAGDRGILPRALQSISELPSALRGAGDNRECQRQTEEDLSLVRDAVGDSAPVARLGAASAAGALRG